MRTIYKFQKYNSLEAQANTSGFPSTGLFKDFSPYPNVNIDKTKNLSKQGNM